MIYKEVFKFFAGAAAWDGIIALWFLLSGIYPISFFGITFGAFGLGIAFFSDVILVFVLSYLAWCTPKNARITRRSSRKTSGRRRRR